MASSLGLNVGLYGDQRAYGAQTLNGYSNDLSSVYALSGLNAPRSALLANPPGLINTSNLNSRYTDSVRLSEQGQVQSALSGLRQSLQAFSTAATQRPVAVASSDNKVLSASADSKAAVPATLDINVSQLATAQQVQSPLISTPTNPNALLGTGRITIQFGRVGASGFVAGDAGQSVIINPANASLSGVANAINQANAGVNAKVLTDSNGSRLQINSTDTGANAAFRIQVSDDDGSSVDNAGLSRLAYEPGVSGNSTVQTQSAQQAAVTIDGRALSSASNTVQDTTTGTTLTLNNTGSATVTLSRDASALAASVRSFVAAFNSAQLQLSQVGTDQAAIAQSQLSRAAQQASASQLSLAGIGVLRASGGGLILDETRLASVLKNNLNGVGDLLGTAAQRLSQAAQSAQSTVSVSANVQAARSLSNSNALQSLSRSIGSLQQSGSYGLSLNTKTLYGLSQYLTVAAF